MLRAGLGMKKAIKPDFAKSKKRAATLLRLI
jgi:hypothetical protein